MWYVPPMKELPQTERFRVLLPSAATVDWRWARKRYFQPTSLQVIFDSEVTTTVTVDYRTTEGDLGRIATLEGTGTTFSLDLLDERAIQMEGNENLLITTNSATPAVGILVGQSTPGAE